MSNTEQTMQPAVATSLALWHDMIAKRDLSGLTDIIRPDVVFRSPAVYKPYESAPVLNLILNTVIQVFEDFTYHRQLVSDDGLNVVLEFSATVSGRELKGIDMIRFDATGKMAEFEVMVRPLSGLQALAAEMGARIGVQLAGGQPA